MVRLKLSHRLTNLEMLLRTAQRTRNQKKKCSVISQPSEKETQTFGIKRKFSTEAQSESDHSWNQSGDIYH